MQFKDVIGQNELKSHLIQEVLNDKISHAQLFLGNSGYGGLALALAFIQYIFCDNKSEKDSCGTCPSCLKVKDLIHPDVHFSFPVIQAENKYSDAFLPLWRKIIQESSYFNLNQWAEFIDEKGRKPIIGSEESLAIIKKLSLKSFEGKFKVMLIWMASEMNPTCSNKLLKILEEPPQNTLFILLSDNQEQLLQTILSRTQILRIPSIHPEDLTDYLNRNFKLDETLAQSIAAQCDGDFIEAKFLMDESSKNNVNRDFFIQMMRVCFKKSPIEMLDWAENIATIGKEKQKIFLKYSLHMFRQSILKNYTDDQLIKVSKEEHDFLKNFSKFITGNNVLEFMESFNQAYYNADRNANPRILFTDLCFKVMRYIHYA